MFDSTIASLLNTYLGKYVANLDGQTLDFGLLGGDLELTDLIIRTDALGELDLPIEVKAGHIGHLKIDIPWTSLFTSNINVVVEDVYLVASPITDRQYDPEKEKLLENAAKQKLLQSLEKPTKKTEVEKESDSSFTEKLAMSFVNRLQVSVRHIHIRYEDTITNGDHAFACGIMLKQILVVSTDSHWDPKGTDTVANLMHKIFQLEEMSVYWNPYVPEQNLIKSRLGTDGWKNVLRKSIDSHSIFEEDLDFVVERVAAKARMILNTASGFNLPKIFMDLTLEEMEILLSRQQFLNVINLQESFQLMSVNQRYRKYHPVVSLKVSPKAWWKYAYTAVVEEKIRPYSWSRIQAHRQQFKTYKRTYKNQLEHPGEEEYKKLCSEMENELDVTNILIAREQAKLEFAKEAPSRANRKKHNKKGWFGSLFSWSDSDDEDDDEVLVIDSHENDNWWSKLTPEEKKHLYAGIGYSTSVNAPTYPPKYIAQKVQVVLKSCSVSLVNYSKKILQVSVNHLLGTVETRPGAKAIRFSCNTESFSIEGASIEHELIPILTSDIGVYAPSVNQVFALDFETKPAYVQADYSLSLNVQPVEIVYDEHSISEVIAFFQLPQGGVDLKAAAVETMSTVAEYSRAGLQYAIEKHTTVHVSLNMRSPYIVIPEYGTLHRGGNVLIADFGTLRVESELQPGDVSLEEATMSEIESRLYDQFNVKISDVKVLLADSGDDWHTAQTQPNSQYHILPSVHMGMTFFNAVKSDFHQLPRHKLEVKVPSLALNASDKRLLLFATFFRNFPMPTSSSMATIGEDMIDGMGTAPNLPLQLNLSDAQTKPDHDMLKSIRKSVLGRPMVDKRDGRKSVTKVPTLMYTTGEESFFSASDFSDEDTEKLSDLLTIKAVDDNGSVANNINILLRISLGELVINISKEMDKEEKAYLMFRVDRLKVDASITVHGYSAYATLGGVQMVDKIHTGPSGEYMEVLSTNSNSNSNLVSIMYRMVEPSCPDFSTYYGGVEHAVKIKVQSMSTLFDQASMMYLNAFVQSILSSLNTTDMKGSTSSISIAMDQTNKDKTSMVDKISLMTEQVENMPPSGIKLNLTAELNDFAIRLADSDNSIAEIKVAGFEGGVVVRPSQTVVRAKLQDLSIRDTSAGAIHPNILVLQDESGSLFDLKFVWYNKSATSTRDNKAKAEGLDYSIRMRVGHVQAAVLGHFYWELRRFFEPFINPEISDAATQTVRDTVTKQVNTIDEHNLRIKLELDFRAPTLLFPHDSKSTEMILVHLGNLRVLSSFMSKQLIADKQQQWNIINIDLSHMQIQRVTLNLVEDTSEILHTILEPLSFKAEVRLAMKPVMSDLKVDISGHLEKVKMYILQKDIQLLLGIYLYNLNEGSPPPSPGMFESPTLQDIQVETHRVDGPSFASPENIQVTVTPAPAQPEQKSLTSVMLKMEGMSLTLLTDNGKELATKTDLCLMDMSKINVSGSFHSDGDIKVNLALYALSIEDIRPESDLAVKRILYCTRKDDTFENFPLISFIYKASTDNSHTADLMVEKLRLNVHIPYMLALFKFFNGAMAALSNQSPPALHNIPINARTSSGRPGIHEAPRYTIIDPNEVEPPAPPPTVSEAAPAAPPFKLTMSGNLREPEIVLFADPTKLDSRMAVLHSDVAFEYRTDSSTQFVMATVTDLQLITQMNIKGSENTRNKVILPCALQFKMETDLQTGAVDASASISKIQVFLCTSVMQLIWDVSTMLMEPTSAEKDKSNSSSDAADKDMQNLWNVSKVTSERWLQDRADGGFIHHMRPSTTPKESLTVEIKDINLYFEIETKDLHVPILHLHTSLEATIEEWTRKMHVESELHLQVLYFNEKVSVWEPLVEPIMEREGYYRPWEVIFKLVKAPTFPMICKYDDNDLTIPEELQTEVQQMMHRARVKSSSSETDDADTELDMTVIRHKSLRRLRHGSERSYDPSRHSSDESDCEPDGFLSSVTSKLGNVYFSDSSDADDNDIYNSSRHSSVQGESDSEPDGFISSMTSKLGNIFSSDSSDADVSETDDNDDNMDLSLDKPVFLTSRGPVHMSAAATCWRRTRLWMRKTTRPCRRRGFSQFSRKPFRSKNRVRFTKRIFVRHDQLEPLVSKDSMTMNKVGGSAPPGIDEVDAGPSMVEYDDYEDKCMYVIVESMDPLQLNVTPQALVVLKDVASALTNSSTSELESVRNKPTFTIDNRLELHAYVTVDSSLKSPEYTVVNNVGATVHSAYESGKIDKQISKDDVINATIYHSDTDNIIHAADYSNDIEIIDLNNKDEGDHDCDEDGRRISSSLAKVGHTLMSAGAFVFDDDDDYLSGAHLDKFRLKLQVDGFEQTPSLLHKRACKRLVPLIPTKNGVKYCVVMDVDMWHGRKIVQLYSPLKLQNNLTLAMDIYCRSEDLKKFKATRELASNEKFSKIATVDAESTYHIPLFVAYHCPIYIKPADISYELTYNSLWWPEMLQGKDRLKSFLCMSSQEEQKSFHFKAVCREGEKLKPAQTVPKSLPYYTITLYPPVILHNYLPYDINFNLQGLSTPSSLTHGEATPLYTVDTSNSYKLLITLPDYMECDWLGTLDISADMDEFRAITMETEADSDNVNRHLSISIHADLSNSLDLRIYSPYWIINKTDIPLQLRGSLSEAVYEFNSAHNLLLFRFKRNKRKKAKLRVYESRWSQSFSTDTVGSGGVVICNDKERGKKYMFLVHITMSKLQLTKIVTIMPFFLCINQSSHKLRYMEDNENADLWIDIDEQECQPFWPVTESFNMYVKFDGSNVSSLHFPIKSCHKTVLRMDQGRALCVEVTGGTETPITIIFTNYEIGDAPARVDNLCEDVFIKIHQKNQSQVTLLSPNQSILYTWDEPTAERTLMWNVYGRKKPSYPAFINKDGSDEVRLRVPSLKAIGSMSVDLPETNETDEHSSPEDESDDDTVDAISTKTLIGKTRSDKMVIFWVSYLDGHQRVLLFTQDERVAKSLRKGHVQSVDLPRRNNRLQINEGENVELAVFASLEGITVSVVNGLYKEMALLTVSSCPALWEVEVKDKWRSLNVELSTWLEDQWRGGVFAANLQGHIEADLSKMQMMKPFMGSLRRTFHPGIWCQYQSSKCHTAINASIQTLQIDNQLPDAYFATPLSPTPLPSYIARRMGPKPFVELMLMRRTVPDQNIDTIRYAKVLVQEFNLKLDKGFILSLVDLVSDLIPKEKESQCLQRDLVIVKQSVREAAAVLLAARPQKIYFEYIHLSPLKFHISLSLSGTVMKSDLSNIPASSSLSGDIIDFFLNSVGVTLTEIKNVELRLAYFERKGVLMTNEQLMSQVQSHFTHQALQQAYVLILGLDVLGNPYGLIKDFTQGLGDFFYEPFLGSIQGQDEFAKGLAMGVHSLMGNTVGGAAGSVSMITGGVGRTIAALSFDSEYKKKRRVRMQQQPTDLPSSLMEASKTLAIGVGLGLSGVVLDPIKGAHEDGVEGFFKGIGKGLLGLLTKPTGGVIDMVSMAFDGIRRAAEMDSGIVARKRPPRFVNPHLGLRPYSPYKAAGNRLLQSVMKGELVKSDIYYAHAALTKEEKANVILITDKHLLLVERCRFWGGWAVDWKVPIISILGVPAVLDGKMVFKVKQEDCGINLFSSGEKEIISKESDILEWVQRQITRVIKYNEQ